MSNQMAFSVDEDAFLIHLREKHKLSWPNLTNRFTKERLGRLRSKADLHSRYMEVLRHRPGGPGYYSSGWGTKGTPGKRKSVDANSEASDESNGKRIKDKDNDNSEADSETSNNEEYKESDETIHGAENNEPPSQLSAPIVATRAIFTTAASHMTSSNTTQLNRPTISPRNDTPASSVPGRYQLRSCRTMDFYDLFPDFRDLYPHLPSPTNPVNSATANETEQERADTPPNRFNCTATNFKSPAGVENKDGIRDDFINFGMSAPKVDELMNRPDTPVGGTAQQPYGHQSKSTKDESTSHKRRDRAQRMTKAEKYENLCLSKKPGNWVLFDPTCMDRGGIPTFMVPFKTYEPGNKRILEFNTISHAIRTKSTPDVLKGKSVEYTPLGPRIVEDLQVKIVDGKKRATISTRNVERAQRSGDAAEPGEQAHHEADHTPDRIGSDGKSIDQEHEPSEAENVQIKDESYDD